jgi:GxxExxY protein
MDLLKQSEIIYKQESFEIIGDCLEVHKVLGCGFLEAVYQEALAIEFKKRGIPIIQGALFNIYYKDHLLKKEYVADFMCFNKIIVECKALSLLISDNISQTLNYLKVTDCKLNLLVNFGESSLKYKRIVL